MFEENSEGVGVGVAVGTALTWVDGVGVGLGFAGLGTGVGLNVTWGVAWAIVFFFFVCLVPVEEGELSAIAWKPITRPRTEMTARNFFINLPP